MMKKGFSLIEILVVLAVFSLLAIVSTEAILLTLKGTRKADTSIRVRENLGFAIASLERQIHNAQSASPCPNSDTSSINIEDQLGTLTAYTCTNVGPSGYVASGSARLTSDNISVTNCSFTCTPATSSVPQSITIDLSARDSTALGSENTQVTTTTKVYLRTY
jgi:prepilin-type N-terminal cleavage/methylation domain-containing protein